MRSKTTELEGEALQNSTTFYVLTGEVKKKDRIQIVLTFDSRYQKRYTTPEGPYSLFLEHKLIRSLDGEMVFC